MSLVIDWDEDVAAPPTPPGGPSVLMQSFNYLGIASHGGWFLIYPLARNLDPNVRMTVLSILAIPLLLGHIHLWHVLRRLNAQGRD